MKKLYFNKIIIFLFLSFCLMLSVFFSSCKDENHLMPFVTETRTDIYQANNSEYPLKCYYGKKDGKEFLYFFTSGGEIDMVSVFLEMELNGETVKKEFVFDPVKNALSITFPVENFTEKEFTVTILKGSDKEDVTLISIIPKNCLSLNQILNSLCEKQSALIKTYLKDGVFIGNICARIIVKSEKAYWYIGLTDETGKLTAFLMDGIDGSVKAVREVL